MAYAYVPLDDRLVRIGQYTNTVEVLEKVNGRYVWIKVQEPEETSNIVPGSAAEGRLIV